MRRNSNLLALLVGAAHAALFLAPSPAAAQPPRPAAAAPSLFGSEEPLALKLEASVAGLGRGRAEPEYEPARLTLTTADGTFSTDLRVRARGKSRRQVCSFPPLLLNFKTKSLEGTVLAGQDRLKLVTHCEPRDTNFQYVFLEYLAYRVLNLVTDDSLRVRLVEMTYVDTDRKRETPKVPAILIEDEEAFAARRGLETVAMPRIERGRYDEQALGLIETFQYFIGNTDWSAFAGPTSTCCHNVVPLRRADGSLLPVPYDFDSAGIVDAAYALPDERLRIQSVRQRLYRGPCRSVAALQATFAPFEQRRTEIRALFESDPRLSPRNRAKALAYVDSFYASLADPKLVERQFRADCRS